MRHCRRNQRELPQPGQTHFLFKFFQNPPLHQKYYEYEQSLQTIKRVPDCFNNRRRRILLEIEERRHHFEQKRNAHDEEEFQQQSKPEAPVDERDARRSHRLTCPETC